MTLNALALHFLKYMDSQKEPASIGAIKSRMLGFKNISAEDVLQELKDMDYIEIDGIRIKIAKNGKNFLENLQKEESEQIKALVFDDYDLALIGFLFRRNDFVNLEDFPEILRVCAPQHGNSINDGNLIRSLFRLQKYIDEQHDWYVINDIGKAYYENKIRKYYQETKQDNTTYHNDSKEQGLNDFSKMNLEIPKLTEPERLWLTELYSLAKSGKRFTYRDLWAKLNDKLPRNFKTAAVDERLMSSNGEKIWVLGVAAVEKGFQIVHQINTIVDSIRAIILNDEKITQILIEEIAKLCGLATKEVSFSLELARGHVNLYNSCSYKENSTELLSIDVSGSEAIFYNYLHFDGIEYYLVKQNDGNKTETQEQFSQDEISTLNEKLDHLMEEMRKVVLSHEFTYNDVMEELEELKTLYGLKKKNWKRLLVAKVTEMTAGGIISSLIADPLADIIKPEINKLLTQ